jgi:hypothetical protein
MTRYWFDTEVVVDGSRIELLSIGAVCEDGRQFYAESSEVDLAQADQWVQDNVLPQLGKSPEAVMTLVQIADELIEFVNAGISPPEFWAYCGDYNWVALCQLFGTTLDLPRLWPLFAMDLKQLAISLGDPKLPEQTSDMHHALADALWIRDSYLWLTGLRAEDVDASFRRLPRWRQWLVLAGGPTSVERFTLQVENHRLREALREIANRPLPAGNGLAERLRESARRAFNE